MKKKKKAVEERTLVIPLLLTMLISFIEPALIIAGILPPVYTFSPGNILFALADYAVVAYVAFSRADEGLRVSAINGLALGFASASIICSAGLIGSNIYGMPVIGISVDSKQFLFSTLVMLVIESTILVSLFSVLVTWLTIKFKQKPKRPSPQ
jgi:hypothetical protein